VCAFGRGSNRGLSVIWKSGLKFFVIPFPPLRSPPTFLLLFSCVLFSTLPFRYGVPVKNSFSPVNIPSLYSNAMMTIFWKILNFKISHFNSYGYQLKSISFDIKYILYGYPGSIHFYIILSIFLINSSFFLHQYYLIIQINLNTVVNF
jgi:hypothetical protein